MGGRTRRSVRLVATAMAVDALGSGLVAPFGLLVGTAVVGLSLTATGLTLSVAGALGLTAGPMAGAAVDRYGASLVVVVSNILAAISGIGVLLAQGVVDFGLASFVGFCASRGYWAAFAPLISELMPVERRERAFGRLRAAQYSGLTLGAGLAAGALTLGQRRGLQVLVAGDAVTYVAAATLVLVARASWPSRAPGRPVAYEQRASYRTVLRDRDNLLLAALNVACTLMCMAPVMAMSVYVLQRLDLQPWLPGVLVAASTAALVVSVLVTPRVFAGRLRLTVLAAANVVWAAAALLFVVAGLLMPALAVTVLVLAMVLYGVAEGMHAPTSDALPLVLAPPGLAGRYTALHQLAWGVSAIIAPAMTGLLLAVSDYAVWLALAGIAAAAAAAYVSLRRRLAVRTGTVGALAPQVVPAEPVG